MKNILCFGDSNTYGLKPDGSGRYDFNSRWPGILQHTLGADYHIIEEGLCGRTTIYDDPQRPYKNGKDFLLPLIESHRPLDLIIIMLGTNDCKSIYSLNEKEISDSLGELIHIIQSSPSSNNNLIPEILILSPIHLKDGVWREELDIAFDKTSVEVSKRLSSKYHQLAKQYHCNYLNAANFAKASQIDAEHLDEYGHKQLADALVPEILTIFKRQQVA